MKIESKQTDPMSADVENAHTSVKKLPTQIEIQDWIINYLAELLGIKPDRIDVTVPFDRYGIDSSAAIGLIGDLQRYLEIDLDPTVIYNYPSVEALVQYLTEFN